MTTDFKIMEDSSAQAQKQAEGKQKQGAQSLFTDAYSIPAAKKQAQAIHDAEFHTTWGFFDVHSPEDDKVDSQIKNMSPTDLYGVEQQYQKMFGKTLTDDISHNLNSSADIKNDISLINTANLPHDLANNLQAVATKYIPDTVGADGKNQRQTFLNSMNTFVNRAIKAGMSNQEIATTFGAIQRLLEQESSVPGLTSADRINAAEGIMGEAANPGHTDQGFHDTCGASAIEDRMFALQPANAANMISSIALTGKYKAEDGKTISIPLDRSTILPGTEESEYPPQDGTRSYASQLFQVGVMNDLAQQQSHDGEELIFYGQEELSLPSTFPKGTGAVPVTAYDQGAQTKTNTGEYWVGKNGSKVEFPGLAEFQVQSAYEDLTGNSTPFVAGQLGVGSSVEIDSANALVKAVQAHQASGQLPMTLNVDASKPPFNDTEGGPGTHFVDITGVSYRNGVPYFQVANSWGTLYDKAYPASEIYAASVS
jgi:hypothetical protein